MKRRNWKKCEKQETGARMAVFVNANAMDGNREHVWWIETRECESKKQSIEMFEQRNSERCSPKGELDNEPKKTVL